MGQKKAARQGKEVKKGHALRVHRGSFSGNSGPDGLGPLITFIYLSSYRFNTHNALTKVPLVFSVALYCIQSWMDGSVGFVFQRNIQSSRKIHLWHVLLCFLNIMQMLNTFRKYTVACILQSHPHTHKINPSRKGLRHRTLLPPTGAGRMHS